MSNILVGMTNVGVLEFGHACIWQDEPSQQTNLRRGRLERRERGRRNCRTGRDRDAKGEAVKAVVAEASVRTRAAAAIFMVLPEQKMHSQTEKSERTVLVRSLSSEETHAEADVQRSGGHSFYVIISSLLYFMVSGFIATPPFSADGRARW